MLAQAVGYSSLPAAGSKHVKDISAPVVRSSWETGHVSGRWLRRAFDRPAEKLPPLVVSLLLSELNVREVADVRFMTLTESVAVLFRSVPGVGGTWSHADSDAGRDGGSGLRWEHTNTHCLHCGNRLADALSIARGYGPQGYAVVQRLQVGRVRMRAPR